MRLDGKIAVVTGGTRAIGRATVERFAEEGARVVFSGRNPDEGREVESQFREQGHEVWYVRADSNIEDDVRGLIAKAVIEGGRLDVLVNNAAPADYARPGGVGGVVDQSLHEITDEAIDQILRSGLYGVLWACRHALRAMLPNGSGSIVNMSSAVSVLGFPATPLYAVTKGAMNSLTKQLATDYGRFGIRSNAVIIGNIPNDRERQEAVVASRTREAAVKGELPAPAFGTPYDIANASVYLASDESSFLNGTIMAVDGGMTNHWFRAFQGWDLTADGVSKPGVASN